MGDDSAAKIRESRRNWMSDHGAMYLRSGGTEGHIMDITVMKAIEPIGVFRDE